MCELRLFELIEELVLFVIDERDERADDVSIGELLGLVTVGCFDCDGRTDALVLALLIAFELVGIEFTVVDELFVIDDDVARARRTDGGYFFSVATAVTPDGADCSTIVEGFKRLIGPGRFSTSHDDADR